MALAVSYASVAWLRGSGEDGCQRPAWLIGLWLLRLGDCRCPAVFVVLLIQPGARLPLWSGWLPPWR